MELLDKAREELLPASNTQLCHLSGAVFMMDYYGNGTIGNSRNQAEEERPFDLRNKNICHK